MGYYIKVEPNVKIYIEDLNPEGNKTILFLHGWPGNHKLFEYQFNQLPRMGYRCIGIDTRGFGDSDKPWSGYNFDRLSDDVACVINVLKLHDIVLAGHSTGGAIAIRYMARHKSYGVAKLVLCAAVAPSLIKRPDFPYGMTKDDVNQLIQQTYTDRPSMLQDFGNMFFYQTPSQPFSDWFFHLGLQAASWATIALAVSLRDESLFNDLEKIHVPTLILHGVHDQVCPFSLGEAHRQGIKHSKLVPFKNSGHGLFWEEAEKFNLELAEFIGDDKHAV
ncbi:MAG TPA: alpha/beta hydrolase [Clostridiaceae bacterium]|nr:alpha/beta hydrolase [Clostridiaceae bacterium]